MLPAPSGEMTSYWLSLVPGAKDILAAIIIPVENVHTDLRSRRGKGNKASQRGCENPPKKIRCLALSRPTTSSSNDVLAGKKFWFRGTPLPYPLLKALTGAGFAKMVCKILSRKGLEVNILITKNLRAVS
jgi:hypothetical protein